MSTAEDLGERILALRHEHDWNQYDVARRMNEAGHTTWGHATVSLTEKGQRHLRLYEGISLATIFTVSLRDLAFGERPVDLMVASRVERLRRERASLHTRLRQLDRLLAPYEHFREVL